ncbi:hypothetical protein HZH68_002488 [Vespula germanica]|uniref:Uncharacterized protein n=1 Tax=Vespula germanica TaxID=30212 RepID=A0A834U0E1_VESGE|nr:hypothetical protein HZH68_002488 [Vespula germanica]
MKNSNHVESNIRKRISSENSSFPLIQNQRPAKKEPWKEAWKFASTTLLARAFKASKSSFHFTSSPTETFKDSIFVVLTSKLNPINVQEDLRVLFIMLAHIRKSPGMTETEGQTSTLICC